MKDVNATIVIDIQDKSEEEVFKDIEYTRRKNVKKAIRNGVYSKKTNSEEDYKRCYELYSKIILKGGSTPFEYLVWRKWAKEENWELFAVKKGDEIMGYYSVILIDYSYYGLSDNLKGVRPRVFASDDKFHEFRTNDFIYWSTIKYGLDNNLDFVDLGGWQINARDHLKEVNKFKERWGGEVFYFYLDYPWYTAISRKLVRNSSIFWKLNELVKSKKVKEPKPFILNKN